MKPRAVTRTSSTCVIVMTHIYTNPRPQTSDLELTSLEGTLVFKHSVSYVSVLKANIKPFSPSRVPLTLPVFVAREKRVIFNESGHVPFIFVYQMNVHF